MSLARSHKAGVVAQEAGREYPLYKGREYTIVEIVSRYLARGSSQCHGDTNTDTNTAPAHRGSRDVNNNA